MTELEVDLGRPESRVTEAGGPPAPHSQGASWVGPSPGPVLWQLAGRLGQSLPRGLIRWYSSVFRVNDEGLGGSSRWKKLLYQEMLLKMQYEERNGAQEKVMAKRCAHWRKLPGWSVHSRAQECPTGGHGKSPCQAGSWYMIFGAQSENAHPLFSQKNSHCFGWAFYFKIPKHQ